MVDSSLYFERGVALFSQEGSSRGGEDCRICDLLRNLRYFDAEWEVIGLGEQSGLDFEAMSVLEISRNFVVKSSYEG